MWRIMRVIVILWAATIALILSAMTIHPGNTCQRPVLLDARSNNSYIIDLQTGIAISYQSSATISPDNNYRFSIEQDNRGNHIYLHNNHGISSRLLYSTDNVVQTFWSADSQRLFIREGEPVGRILLGAERLFSIHILSGDMSDDYGVTAFTPVLSPDNHFLYVMLPDPELPATRLASIDTITGEIIAFDPIIPFSFHTWSQDNQWMAVRDTNRTYIIDARTGEPHPQFSESIEGWRSQWTRRYLWIRRFGTDNRVDLWQVSLETGDVALAHEDILGFRVSSNERWQMVWQRTANETVAVNLYDTQNDVIHRELQFFDGDFSEDERCLLVLPSLAGNDAYTVEVYNLNNFSRRFSRSMEEYPVLRDAGITTGSLRWYDDN